MADFIIDNTVDILPMLSARQHLLRQRLLLRSLTTVRF